MKKSSKNWLLPIVAIALAIGGAFATNCQGNLLPTGYASVHMPCDTPVDCSFDFNTACKAPGGQTAYGKVNPLDGTCPIILYKRK